MYHMDKKYIVFGVEHYNPLGIIRSLGEKGIRPIAIVIRGKKRITSRSKYIKELHFVKDVSEGISLLLSSFGDSDNPPFLFTADDTSTVLINEKYQDFVGKFIFYNTGNSEGLRFFLNKQNIGELAMKCGLNFLKSWSVSRGDIPEDIIFPVLTKALDPTVGGWKDDSFVCNSIEELTEAYKKIKSERILLQRYIDKKNEIAFEGFSTNRGKNAFLSIETDYDYLIPNYYSPYMTIHPIRNVQLIEPLKKMLRTIGFEGIFEIEFLVDQDGTLYFGEINFRNATWSYASTVAGMNLPYLWSKEMENNEERNLEVYRTNYQDFHAMVELPDLKYRVFGKKISIFTWILQYLGCKCKYYTGKHDILPLISSLKK